MKRAHVVVSAIVFATTACGNVEPTASDASPPAADASQPAVDAAPAAPDATLTACTPSTTVCSGSTLVTCDAAGDVIESRTCPLDCHPGGERCFDIEPSNGLAAVFAGTGFADLLLDNVTIDTDSGAVTDSAGADVPVSTVVVAQAQGPMIRVVLANVLTIGNTTVTGGLPLAFVAKHDVNVVGHIDVAAQSTRPGPGASTQQLCAAGDAMGVPVSIVPGSGGGGFGSAGAKGGSSGTAPGGSPVMSHGLPEIRPLRGGCRGGHVFSGIEPVQVWAEGGAGGGAVQIVSRTRIDVSGAASIIGAGGGGGTGSGNGAAAGGSGGAILLEAPIVRVAGVGSGLYANGGAGACRNADGSDAHNAPGPASGAVCPNPYHGDGGDGAYAGVGATMGLDAISQATNLFAGGGGGGSGRIRVNTSDGNYELGAGATVSPAASTGTVGRK